ncbi:hypothetical protein IAI10_16035 [Clostridium sp. 19966]|uniref:DUF6320 domain-containing protein n=1 Tax=Clostridium sp. 19966 TaxID=2768166 RepID=UPI0028DFAEF0|nr:DUF6320 domain-containing protein [Clostridium sp. 19966]MDT8718177.1 hypothetical protein [Clostridium sp. 19966]
MKCRNCHVEIKYNANNCPLCGKHLIEKEEYKVYPGVGKGVVKTTGKQMKISIFILVSASIILFIINLLTPHYYFWCTVAIFGIWLTFFIIVKPLIKKKITAMMVVEDNILVSVFLVVVDSTFNQNGWAMSYVVPFVLWGSSLIVTVIVICIKMTWKEFYLFQTSIVIICFIPIVARLIFKFVLWPSIISAVYGVITIIAMIIFGDKKFKYETKKRMHF